MLLVLNRMLGSSGSGSLNRVTLAPYKGETFCALLTGAPVAAFNDALEPLEMVIFRRAHFCVSLSISLPFSLSVRACVRAWVASPQPSLSSVHRGAQTRCSDAFQLRVRLRPFRAYPALYSRCKPRFIPSASPPHPLLWFFSCRRSGAGSGAVCDRSISMNMAFIGDADPFTAAIPATKVELTVSCRWVNQSCR